MTGICVCGLMASMSMAYMMMDGSIIPRCGTCARRSAMDRYSDITKEMFDRFTIQHIMTS